MTTEQMPQWWQGTHHEWIAFQTLESMGRQHNRDFIYQPEPEEKTKFKFINPEDLGINIVGFMQNYESGFDETAINMLSKQQLMGMGIQLIFIEDVDLTQDATYYIEEALKYRDHSHMGS